MADPEKKVVMQGQYRVWSGRNPVKRKAEHSAGNAIRDGKLKRPSCCSACGVNCIPHAHHEDYTKPLDVIWLCTRCHGKRHREINEMKRAGVDLSTNLF